jgi:hypothetical protein
LLELALLELVVVVAEMLVLEIQVQHLPVVAQALSKVTEPMERQIEAAVVAAVEHLAAAKMVVVVVLV